MDQTNISTGMIAYTPTEIITKETARPVQLVEVSGLPEDSVDKGQSFFDQRLKRAAEGNRTTLFAHFRKQHFSLGQVSDLTLLLRLEDENWKDDYSVSPPDPFVRVFPDQMPGFLRPILEQDYRVLFVSARGPLCSIITGEEMRRISAFRYYFSHSWYQNSNETEHYYRIKRDSLQTHSIWSSGDPAGKPVPLPANPLNKKLLSVSENNNDD